MVPTTFTMVATSFTMEAATSTTLNNLHNGANNLHNSANNLHNGAQNLHNGANNLHNGAHITMVPATSTMVPTTFLIANNLYNGGNNLHNGKNQNACLFCQLLVRNSIHPMQQMDEVAQAAPRAMDGNLKPQLPVNPMSVKHQQSFSFGLLGFDFITFMTCKNVCGNGELNQHILAQSCAVWPPPDDAFLALGHKSLHPGWVFKFLPCRTCKLLGNNFAHPSHQFCSEWANSMWTPSHLVSQNNCVSMLDARQERSYAPWECV